MPAGRRLPGECLCHAGSPTSRPGRCRERRQATAHSPSARAALRQADPRQHQPRKALDTLAAKLDADRQVQEASSARPQVGTTRVSPARRSAGSSPGWSRLGKTTFLLADHDSDLAYEEDEHERQVHITASLMCRPACAGGIPPGGGRGNPRRRRFRPWACARCTRRPWDQQGTNEFKGTPGSGMARYC